MKGLRGRFRIDKTTGIVHDSDIERLRGLEVYFDSDFREKFVEEFTG